MSSEIGSPSHKPTSSDDPHREAVFWFVLTAVLSSLFAGAVFAFIL